MPWHKTAASHYNVQLGLPDKGRAIKGMVVFRGNGRFTPKSQEAEYVSRCVESYRTKRSDTKPPIRC